MIEDNKSPMDFFGESVNLNGGDDNQIMTTIQPEPEEEENIEQVEDELDDNEDIETPLEADDNVEVKYEEDLENYTGAAVLAKTFVEEGVLPEDFKFDNNLTGAELKKALYEESVSGLDPKTYFESQGYSEKVFEMAANIVSGVDPSMAYESNRFQAISNLNLDDNPEYAENILKLDYAEKGLDESTIEDLIATKIEKGEEVEDAKKVQKRFAEKAKQLIKDEQDRVQKATEKREELKNQVIDIITKKDNIGISQRDRKELVDYVYKPTETIVQDIQGKKVKSFVSKFKRDFDKIFTDPEEFVKFANSLKGGWDMSEKEKSSKVDTALSTIDSLNRRINNKSNNKKPKAKDIFENLTMLSLQ